MVQAYHNELVTKVTLLEQQNTQLKKEKVRDFIHVFPRLCFLFVAFFPRLSVVCLVSHSSEGEHDFNT
jgi:hypothetical protein